MRIEESKLRTIIEQEIKRVLLENEHETVGDIVDSYSDAKIIGPGDSFQSQLKRRYNTDKPVFVVVGHDGSKKHMMVWSATAKGRGAPVKRLQ